MNDTPTCPECEGRNGWHKAGCSYTGATPPPTQASKPAPATQGGERHGRQERASTAPPAKQRSAVASGFGGCLGVALAVIAVAVALFVLALMLGGIGNAL